MIFKPPKSLGLGLGLTALALLAGVEAVLWAFWRATPAALTAFLALCLGVVCLSALAFIGYRCYGLARARYVLSRNALVVDWGWRRELVPLPKIRSVLVVTEPRELARLRPRGLSWPGCLVGQANLPSMGEVEFLAATSKAGLVLVRYGDRTLALSPAEPQVFVNAFNQLHAEGPSAQIEPESEVPAFSQWALWRDRPALALLGLGMFTGVVLMGYLLLMGAAEGNQAGAPLGPFPLPWLVGFIWSFNTLLGLWLRQRSSERPMAYLVWSATLFTQALIWGAVLNASAAR
jgi:hypothetical protein